MSLSSLLLGQTKTLIDKELDSLFQNPVVKPAIPGPSKSTPTPVKKRKLDDVKEELDSSVKRVKSSIKTSDSNTNDVEKPKPEAKVVKIQKPKKAGKGKAKEIEPDATDSEDDEKLEAAYLKGQAASKTGDKEVVSEEEDEEDVDPSTLVHESIKKSNKKSRAPKVKYAPSEETPELRDQRTVFVGNLPLDVASKKPLSKQLQRHILSFLPTAKIESIRFRSIPFQAPTTKLPTSDDESNISKPKSAAKKETRQHIKDRTSTWRSTLDEKDEDGLQKDEKRFLNPSQKKKIAFINHEFHSTADSVNAYIVFAHPPNLEGRPANLPPPPPTMDPYEAARLAAKKCNNTLFMKRMLRVDLVGENAHGKADNEAVKAPANLGTDPRLSVFVGNLDFASKEEDLRVFFEGVVSTERGPPPPLQEQDGEDTASKKPATWVTGVRIVRDKDSQLGKGFAYVQFADRECVDEILALEETKLKFAKRKLRVQRCKIGGKQAPQSKAFSTATAIEIPKGDPRLGERLHGLPKEERKQLKSSDADRVARRLAKKKARNAMKPSVGKMAKRKGGKDRKDRKRVRSS
ncbi:Nucleolar protein 12 [Psilocybe cubensis]|uniref:Nucleolar protein 12 n=2 Tax=Psilocybe cubensis TaxID=181762 RepID=A0ACB8GYC0_PSICU|nr:Nucleolar protein 12 [Psilocybe cubensis]KAH9480621.1 Nucleolar protein 12 [Psilocybe cubensis]